MKRLIFEIVKHGVHNPDTFPGCGVAGTHYTHRATGSGSSEHAAGEDAHEIFWQAKADFEKVSMLDLVVLEGEIAKLDVEENAHDNCIHEDDHEMCTAAHYVTIRWRLE